MTAQKNNRLGGQRQKDDFWLFNFMKIMKKVRWVVGALILALLPVAAFASDISVTPITWDVVGLDSNRPLTEGPQYFPVGAEVCNTSGTARDITVKLVWGTGSDATYIKERSGSLTTLIFPAVPNGDCVDAYYEIELTRDSAAFGKTRNYSIKASYDDSGTTVTASTPDGRQIHVERLVSQNRNVTRQIRYCDPSVAGNGCLNLNGTSWVILGNGGGINLSVGGRYFIELKTETSTSYEEVQSFLTLSNTIFQVLSVYTTYDQQTAPVERVPKPNPQLWADGCLWDSDPDSPNYHSCLASGKAGGIVTTLYEISIITGGGDTVGLEALIYDRSGGSFHYNTDYSESPGEINVFKPVDAGFSKRFIPSETYKDGTATLRFNITNIYPVKVSEYNFSDTLPSGMEVASTPNASSTCGGIVTAAVGSGSVSFADGEIGPNGSCTIRVDVTTPFDAGATYPLTLNNQSDNLFIGTIDTGKNATATLTVTEDPPPPMTCAPLATGTTLAAWNDFNNGTAPTATSIYSGVSASASSGSAIAGTFAAAQGEWRFSTSTDRTENQAVTDDAYIEFRVDTTGITSVNFNLTAYAQNGQAPQYIRLYYGPAGSLQQNIELHVPQQNQKPLNNFIANGLVNNLNSSGETVFRVYLYTGSGNSPIRIDDVLIKGEGTVCTPSTGTPPTSPSLTKSFLPNSVRVGEVSTLTFTLNNPNTSGQLTGVTFRDELPAGMKVANPLTVGGTCDGTWNPVADDTVLNFTNGILNAGSNCTLTVNVISTSIGENLNLTDPVNATETVAGNSAEATLIVLPPPETPSIVKYFNSNPLLDPTGLTKLTFKITNNDQSLPLSSVAFTDTLPNINGVQMQPKNDPIAPSYTGCGILPS
ncbi:MAG: DUF11 domain-containing protein, partial [Candidatus Electrothrix sp. AX1]|nr:DUF11 domain-containing protein [Candidatus Electrothrix sp. AX1]